MTLSKKLCCLVCVLSIACGDDDSPDASTDLGMDLAADALSDATLDVELDVGPADSIPDLVLSDATVDSVEPLAGFGQIIGSCGVLAAELDSSAPSYFEVHFDFADDGFDDPQERPMLTESAQQILEAENSGGSSEISEAFAMEVLARCESATLLKTETEIQYDPADSDKTDILVDIDTKKVGISVVRAFAFPADRDYTLDDAAIIQRKLDSIIESSQNVSDADRWVKQSLVVMAYEQMHADVVEEYYASLPSETKADTVMYVIVTDGMDDAIY